MTMLNIKTNWKRKAIGITLSCFLLQACEKTEYAPVEAVEKIAYDADVENYNYVFGTQTFGPTYKFTNDTKLVETAKRIREMGSNTIKIALDHTKYDDLTYQETSLTDLVKNESSFSSVMAMDFKYYFFWAYTNGVNWFDGLTTAEKDMEYANIFNFTKHLLETYNNSGKEFYIGHWEGDWHLLDNYNASQQTVDPVKIQGMIDWYVIRQKAMDDALAATAHTNVKVYQYAELSEVNGAIYYGYDRVVNKVLPFTTVDFASFSSYVSINNPEYIGMRQELGIALDYIEQQLPAKPGITGKRVFIGEFGFPKVVTGTDAEQNRRALNVMKAGLDWGCPFVLYWAMYNNEVDVNGGQRGFWMIDNNGMKQMTYYTHERFYADMKKWVNDYKTKNGSLPSFEAYKAAALLKL
jgi:hypothetical protein